MIDQGNAEKIEGVEGEEGKTWYIHHPCSAHPCKYLKKKYTKGFLSQMVIYNQTLVKFGGYHN